MGRENTSSSQFRTSAYSSQNNVNVLTQKKFVLVKNKMYRNKTITAKTDVPATFSTIQWQYMTRQAQQLNGHLVPGILQERIIRGEFLGRLLFPLFWIFG